MLSLAGSQASGGNSLRKLKAQPAPAGAVSELLINVNKNTFHQAQLGVARGMGQRLHGPLGLASRPERARLAGRPRHPVALTPGTLGFLKRVSDVAESRPAAELLAALRSSAMTRWRRGWDSNPRCLAARLISSQVR